MRAFITLVSSLVFVACGSGALVPAASNRLAVTPDTLDGARLKVASGTLPAVNELPMRAVYAAHDVALPGHCASVLCVEAAAEGTHLHLTLRSGLPASVVTRPALNAALVLDDSGSMKGAKLAAMKQAAKAVLSHLGANDLVTVLRFDEFTEVLAGPVRADDPSLPGLIDALGTRGGSCLDCALSQAFATLATASSDARQDRVFLFTDGTPTATLTGEGPLVDAAEAGARAGQALSFIGLGLEYPAALTRRLTQVKGASVHFYDADTAATAFDDDFDVKVTPLATDVTVTWPVPMGAISNVWATDATGTTTLTLPARSVFLTRDSWTTVVDLDTPLPAVLDTPTLSYTVDTTTFTQPIGVSAALTSQAHLQSSGVQTARVLALTRAFDLLTQALDAAPTDRLAARALADQAITTLSASTDDDVRSELAFAQSLRALLN